MNLQKIYLKSKIKELLNTPFNKWNNTIIIKLCYYSQQEEFKKYKQLLILLFNEFLIEKSQSKNINSKILFSEDELKEIQIKLKDNENNLLINYLEQIENEKKNKKIIVEKINHKKQNNNEHSDNQYSNNDTDNDNQHNNTYEHIIDNNNKKYINNLNDAEIFTENELVININNFRYIGIFLGIFIIIITFVSNLLTKLKRASYNGSNFLLYNLPKIQSLFNNKLFESLLEKDEIKNLFNINEELNI